MATMKTLNGYGFNATELNGKTSDNYLKKTDTASNSAKLGGKTLAEIMLALYPVGAVYISVNSTSPASLFGGTWEILNDVFLLAAGSYANAGTFGGEATHTLTVNEMPSHTHAIYRNTGTDDNNFSGHIANRVAANDTSDENKQTVTSDATGGGAAHNNMPPYLAVYMWKRVS